MKPLYLENDYKNAKSTDKLPCECYECGKTFYKEKREITCFLKGKTKRSIQFCSISCSVLYRQPKKQLVICSNCNKKFYKIPSQIKKSVNHFCCSSCAASYRNNHKTKGNRRSKLEVWLEEQLTNLYPKFQIDYNKTSIINSELDIYIPSLKLAFELNGIFHYEPIFGNDKLKQIQNNDERKFQACLEKQIELVLIDTSTQKYFKEKTSQKFLDIIINIVTQKLVAMEGLEPPALRI